LGFIVILALDVAVFAYIIYAMGRRSAAAWLFVPYMLWLIFATYLNGYICINNQRNIVEKLIEQNVQKGAIW
jgi:tryptophan-rich sensory protein